MMFLPFPKDLSILVASMGYMREEPIRLREEKAFFYGRLFPSSVRLQVHEG